MPYVFLSPSTQEWNSYAISGSEEEYMNYIADKMEENLEKCNIKYKRNAPDNNAAGAIKASNSEDFDVHLAIHSNAAPEQYYGQYQGVDIYYSPHSRWSKALADIIVKNIKEIYPDPENVQALPSVSLGEVTQTRAAAVLCELGYHDNKEDERWIKRNVKEIADALSDSLCEYFGGGTSSKSPMPHMK